MNEKSVQTEMIVDLDSNNEVHVSNYFMIQ